MLHISNVVIGESKSNYFLYHVFSSSRPLCDEDERALEEEEENSNNRTIMEDGELEQSGNGSSILPPVLPLRNHNSTEAILTSMTSLPSPKTSSSAQHSESNSLKNVKNSVKSHKFKNLCVFTEFFNSNAMATFLRIFFEIGQKK